jgi:ATP-binding cassette subfamily B protein
MASLKVDQVQNIGADFITQIKNILITFFSAYEIIQGHLTLGVLLSIAYIVGQLNVPITQLTSFISTLQSVGFSLHRISEVHNQVDEEDEMNHIDDSSLYIFKDKITLENLNFRYGGRSSPMVLKNINAEIPIGKVTAIVGASGSGKTTLMKLLLKFYQPTSGKIKIDNNDFRELSPARFRKLCGVVMQDGIIFSDTILRNIAMDTDCDEHDPRLINAAKTARIHDFITGLPLGYNAKVGNVGTGLSEGQKQRILIARAIFRNPEFLFLDEATSSLDAENEKLISDGLNNFFENKTVVIIAHRLSTVKNADIIMVLNEGIIAESGTHAELVALQGKYFNLIKNQLELGR